VKELSLLNICNIGPSRDEGVKLLKAKAFEKALDKFSEAMLLAPVKVVPATESQKGKKYISFVLAWGTVAV
jgi:hypothetical protein